MKADKIMTNDELQRALTEQIRQLDAGTGDPSHARIYFVGARTLLTAVKLDVEGAKKAGVPLFVRTKQFLGMDESS